MESPTHATRILEAIDGRFAQHSRRSVRVFPQRLGRPGVPRVRGEGAEIVLQFRAMAELQNFKKTNRKGSRPTPRHTSGTHTDEPLARFFLNQCSFPACPVSAETSPASTDSVHLFRSVHLDEVVAVAQEAHLMHHRLQMRRHYRYLGRIEPFI
jgi:hypothetical protein